MLSIFPIDIFPTGALSSSVITTVWVGVFVVVYLNLRLGTTLSGLVVPGYLVPLLILRPMSASVIIAEGLITYGLARLLAEYLPKRFSYAELFGRDRFFALILISVAVRLLFDGFLLPGVGSYLSEQGIDYDYRNNLHSFGLIIVALIGNQMWNGGLRHGSTALLLYLGISYLIVRYVLMELTNFNISTLGYMYEDLASSILASPKAYIILLVSAFIASRMNLKYGWEFNGILIPSLLALQWYQPEKLLVTLVESVVIYLIAVGLLRLELFKKLHIEGPRQILLFFNISFAYKMVLGFVLVTYLPNHKISDYYAFGYLLSTLLALKMYQKDIAIHIARSTLQTSFAGVLAASVIGFFLTLLPTSTAQSGLVLRHNEVAIESLEADLEQHINTLRVTLYGSQNTNFSGQAAPLEMDRLNALFQDIKRYLDDGSDDHLSGIHEQGQALQLKITRLNQRYLVLEDTMTARGWGVFIFDTMTSSELAIEVPAPLDEIQATDAAASLFRNLSARSLALAGKKRKQSADGTSDTLKNPNTAFQLYHRHFGIQNAIQIRQYNGQSGRRLLGIRAENPARLLALEQSQLWVNKTLPADLNLNRLSKLVGKVDIQWRPAPLENRQRESSPKGFAELFLSPAGIKSILSSSASVSYAVENRTQRIDGYLLSWIENNKKLIAEKGSNSYIAASLPEMLFFDQNVLIPLQQLLYSELAGGWDNSVKPELERINKLAMALNYSLILYHHQSSGEDFLILQENNTAAFRHWGTYVFRVGNAAPYVVEVPRPLGEKNTLAFGANLFERLDASVLLIAGAHPYANVDGSANLLHSANKISLFNLAHQSVLRQAGENALLVLQLRAFSGDGNKSLPQADVMLAKLGLETRDFPLLTDPIEQTLSNYGLAYEYVQGSEETTGYDAAWNAQARYAPFTENKPFYVLWVSPDIRKSYRDQEENRQQRLMFSVVGIATTELDVSQWASQTPVSSALDEPIDLSLLEKFFETENIVLLHRFVRQHATHQFDRLIDVNSGQAFLAIRRGDGDLRALANLQTHNERRQLVNAHSAPATAETRRFVDDRARWLLRSKSG